MNTPLIIPFPAGDFVRRTGVCLNMIVKDETPVIARLLRSVQAVVDYFVIVDTGSSDGTPDLIRHVAEELGLPGEVHFRDWKNFGHNRQQALELALAADRGDWLLFMDADEELVCSDPEFFHRLEAGVTYQLFKHHGDLRYALTNLVDVRQSRWEWQAPVHEYLFQLAGPERRVQSTAAWILYHPGEGSRSRGIDVKDKYLRDATLLEEALRADPDDPRNRFYLAQSYRDAGDYKRALINYEQRSQMRGWDQETYIAQCEKVRMALLLGIGSDKVVPELLKAYKMRPSRAESLWLLARYCRSRGRYEDGYQCARLGLKIPLPTDSLFINQGVYEWGLLDEYGSCALALGRYQEAASAFARILQGKSPPPKERDRIQNLLNTTRQAEQTHLLLRDELYRARQRP